MNKVPTGLIVEIIKMKYLDYLVKLEYLPLNKGAVVKEILLNDIIKETGIKSVVGFDSMARVFSALLGRTITKNTTPYQLQSGDELFVITTFFKSQMETYTKEAILAAGVRCFKIIVS